MALLHQSFLRALGLIGPEAMPAPIVHLASGRIFLEDSATISCCPQQLDVLVSVIQSILHEFDLCLLV